MKTIFLILAVVALSSGQKAYKAGGQKHGGGGGGHYAGEAASYGEAPQKQYNQHSGAYQHQPNHYSGQGAHHGAAATAAKPSYPVLLSDNRQLNQDGTINFNYAADNGLQQGETVDPDGTRRGFYSYIGADGKALTVKYTAGKNGFVAEGDHLPKQPNIAAQTKDEVVSKHSGGGAYQGGPSSGNYYGGAPAHYSANHGGHSPAPHSNGGNNHYSGAGRNQYNPPSPYHDASAARQAFGAYPAPAGHGGQHHGHGGQHHGHGQYQSAPQTQYTQSLPSHSHGHGGGAMHSAFSPYTPSGPAGPYQGQFDLGNGGQFSINFEPGATQEIAYGGGNPGHGGQGQQQQY